MKRLWVFSLVGLASGCGGGDEVVQPTPQPTCGEHEVALPDGSCIRPGVPLDGCAAGFEHDGAYGCNPILPADPCPPGLMAVPGEVACRPVMECGTGRWGDLPVDEATTYVDGSYAGGDSDGSESKPWPTIGEAVTAAAPDAFIAVAEGVYVESVRITGKPLRLWGVCPDRVVVEAAAGPSSTICPGWMALCIGTGADGTEVGGLALRGPGVGVLTSDATNVLLDRLRLHDNVAKGLHADAIFGLSDVELRGSLVEANADVGLFVVSADLTVVDSVIRGTLPNPNNQLFGRGIGVQPRCDETSGELNCEDYPRSKLIVRGSVIEQNHDYGLFVSGAEATVEASVVRNTLPCALDQSSGVGILIQPYCIDTATGPQCDVAGRALATLRGSVVEQNTTMGLSVNGSDAVVERTVVRGTLPDPGDLTHGTGINVQLSCMLTAAGPQCDPTLRGNATVRASLIEHNRDAGLLVMGSEATIEGTVVRSTQPRASDQHGGLGISVQISCLTTAAGLECDPTARGSATVLGSLIEQNHEVGFLVNGSDATIQSSAVRATAARVSDGLLGDGISVVGGAMVASATITTTLIEDSVRAGLGVFGASASLDHSTLGCSAFALAGEVLEGQGFQVDDGGDNRCGCPEADGECKLVSAGLEPPEPLGQ